MAPGSIRESAPAVRVVIPLDVEVVRAIRSGPLRPETEISHDTASISQSRHTSVPSSPRR
jgi:hypothetical protein